MSRDKLIKVMENRLLPLRHPRNHQLKRENSSYKSEMQMLDEIMDDEELNLDIMSRSFIKLKHGTRTKIKDSYDDILADKLCRKSWKDRRKSRNQYKGEK